MQGVIAEDSIYEPEIGKVYLSSSGLPFMLVDFMRYGLNCTSRFVMYTNLVDTKDAKAGEQWCLEESIFIKTFRKPHD
jgi:hypothetical protein